MTPKEKAKYLVQKYLCKIIEFAYAETHYKELAKQCALIAVNEILDSCPMYYTGFEYESNLEYWQKVKTEIKKL